MKLSDEEYLIEIKQSVLFILFVNTVRCFDIFFIEIFITSTWNKEASITFYEQAESGRLQYNNIFVSRD